jgi:uncharacterized protein YhaN
MRHPVLWLLFVFLSGSLLVGGMCPEKRDPAPNPAPIEQPKAPTDHYGEDIEKAQADAEAAHKKGDRLAELEAQKREAVARAEQAEQYAKQWRDTSAKKDVQIKEEHDHQKQVMLWWFSGIMLVVGLAAVALAIWIPATAKWAVRFAIACGVVSGLAIFLAWLVPYLIWIGGTMVVGGLIAAAVWWKGDHKSLTQVVEAVGEAKNKVPEFKAAYKGIFREIIDTDAQNRITAVRERVTAKLAAEAAKAAAALHLKPPAV